MANTAATAATWSTDMTVAVVSANEPERSRVTAPVEPRTTVASYNPSRWAARSTAPPRLSICSPRDDCA